MQVSFLKNTLTFYLLLTGIIWLSGCRSTEIENIVIRGSDTEVNLILVLAEEFMNKNADVSIAVTGGGRRSCFRN